MIKPSTTQLSYLVQLAVSAVLLCIHSTGYAQSIITLERDTIYWWPPEESLISNTVSQGIGTVAIRTRSGSTMTYQVEGGYVVARNVVNERGILTSESFSKEGKLHGLSRRWADDGTLLESGHYEHGMASGEWVFYGKNGKRKLSGVFLADPEAQLKDFLFNEHLLEDETGDHLVIVSSAPRHSPPHGQWLFYDRDGKVAGIIDFDKGQVVGLHYGEVE
jgi:hypothetical protein